MKVVLITSVPGNGGSAATAYHTTRVLYEYGWDAVLFAPGEYWVERGRKENVPVRADLELRRGFHPLSFARDARTLHRFLKEQEPDAVIVQKSPEQWLTFLVLHYVQHPLALVRMRGVVFPIRPTFFNRWIHNGTERILCSASVIAEQYKDLPRFSRNRVKVLLEGVDTARFAPATPEQRAAARAEFNLDPAAFYFGTAGRPSPVKGHDLLVRAFAGARPALTASSANSRKLAHVRLCLFSDESRRGPGSYGDLAGLCQELGVADQVDLRPGYVEDMRKVYHALDAYVLPSRGSEGSSRAALEASASGLPLIASDVGVLPDLIEEPPAVSRAEPRTGRLVRADDEESLGEALVELCERWPEGRDWGASARQRMEKEFSEDRYAELLVKLLYDAIQSARAKAP